MFPGDGGGGGSPVHKPFGYVVPQRVGFLRHFGHFCLESDMIFEEITTGMYEPNCRFNSN